MFAEASISQDSVYIKAVGVNLCMYQNVLDASCLCVLHSFLVLLSSNVSVFTQSM